MHHHKHRCTFSLSLIQLLQLDHIYVEHLTAMIYLHSGHWKINISVTEWKRERSWHRVWVIDRLSSRILCQTATLQCFGRLICVHVVFDGIKPFWANGWNGGSMQIHQYNEWVEENIRRRRIEKRVKSGLEMPKIGMKFLIRCCFFFSNTEHKMYVDWMVDCVVG